MGAGEAGAPGEIKEKHMSAGPEGYGAKSWILPAAFADQKDVEQWSDAIGELAARLDFLDRQMRFMGWSNWLANEKSLSGALSMEIDRNYYAELESDVSTLALNFSDGSRIEQWLGDGNLMRSGEVEIPAGGRRRDAKRAVTEQAESIIEALGNALNTYWPDWREGGLGWKPMSFDAESWKKLIFSADELALWDAAELSKSAQAGKAPVCKGPRI